MRLTFLGTSAGAPTTERNVTALAVALDDSRSWYLVDCGEATQHRLLHCRYTLSRLKAIFITHVHGDHIFGLPGLLSAAVMQGRKDPLTICAPEGVELFIRQAFAISTQDCPFELIFIRSDHCEFSYCDNDVTVTSHGLSHRVPSFAYRFSEQAVPPRLNENKMAALGIPQGPLWGQLQRGEAIKGSDGQVIFPEQVLALPPKKRVVVVGGDNDQPKLLSHVLAEADILVHEATFTEAARKQVGSQWMHSTAKQVAKAATLAALPHLILTHFSGRYRLNAKPEEESVELLKLEAQRYYQGNIILAEDFATWQLQRNKKLVSLGYCSKQLSG
ncbi:MAG: ribonuclease Z [Endozoicomonas sp. (ex Botrylloides leachii)]|nr:ribonuclease Z [Endozoicomonas sp. (ex Botrylloides leachii)]